MYPNIRLRRNRKTHWLRDINGENNLTVNDLILPIFIIDGERKKIEIKSMPGVYKYTIDKLLDVIKEAEKIGIKAIALFPNIDPDLKNEDGDEAYNPDNLVCRAIRSIKNITKNIGIICDVALDPYTSHGHDGILNSELDDVDNDETIEALCNQAIVLAKAGADVIAPSDMMDGRIGAIRKVLDEEGFINVNILSYAVKYNSSFYGPFRDAVDSKGDKYLSKSTYQMDVRNSKEAMAEIEQDVMEGADMIMVKPSMCFLDIINQASNNFNIPVFAYQVSGEYAMMKFAALNGAIDFERSMIESLLSIKRAGANAIFCYNAIEVAKSLL